MRALLLFLSISTATANAAIQISPERPLIDPHPAAPQSGSIPAAVANDGSNFLVIWIGSGGLMATIVSDGGDVPTLPRAPQIPSGGQSSFSEISAVWPGSVYLVTWSGAD